MAPSPEIERGFFSRVERFTSVASTNDVVRAWLAAGDPGVAVAVAREQTAGRGRGRRRWVAPPGSALLLSLGFRPVSVAPELAWRLPATVSLAMADAAEEAAGLPERTIRLKWPNDLVVVTDGPDASLLGVSDAETVRRRLAGPLRIRKLGGVLGESVGLGLADPQVIVGIGVNADWAAADFPSELAPTMTSLREASGGRPVDLDALLEGFLDRIEPRVLALRAGRFDLADWMDRQVTTGREVELALPDGTVELARALGLDARSGALIVADPGAPGGERAVLSGEVSRLRLGSGT